MGLKFGADLRELFSIPRNQDEIVMVTGEELRQLVSNAAGSAGDQDGSHDWILRGEAYQGNILTARHAKSCCQGTKTRGLAGIIRGGHEKGAGEGARATFPADSYAW